MKKTFQERVVEIMEEKEITQADISRATNITQSSLSDYIKGKYSPKQDKVDLIAQALGVSPAYLMGWDDTVQEEPDHYYTNPESAKLAEEIYKNPDLRILFDAARDVEPEDIKVAIDVLERFKKTRR